MGNVPSRKLCVKFFSIMNLLGYRVIGSDDFILTKNPGGPGGPTGPGKPGRPGKPYKLKE